MFLIKYFPIFLIIKIISCDTTTCEYGGVNFLKCCHNAGLSLRSFQKVEENRKTCITEYKSKIDGTLKNSCEETACVTNCYWKKYNLVKLYNRILFLEIFFF